MKKLSFLSVLLFIDGNFPGFPAVVNFFKKHRRRRTQIVYFIFLQFLIPFPESYGQTNNTPPAHYTPPTPMAAQFEKYINYPVNHSTGAASVDVPIYNLNAGAIQIPISLSYHTSGVRPGDPSIPVGLGWVINPGGRVSRKQLSYADELYPRAPYQASYDPVADLLALENMEYSPSSFAPSTNRNAILDGEPDIFTYYTGTGVQGRFIIQQQGNEYVAVPLLLSKDKIKIHTYAGPGTAIDYIEVTDENGVFYRFGKGITTYSSNPGSVANESTGQTSNGWTLTDIISADKSDTVSLTWKNLVNDYVSNWYKKKVNTDNIIITDQLRRVFTGLANETSYGYSSNESGGPQFSDSYYIMTAISGLKYKNQEVKMIYTTGNPTLLTSVEIYSSGTKQRQVDFHISNFITNNSFYKRLDEVSLRDKNNQVVNSYRFGYNEQIQLPGELSRALDFWGYYNGYESNTTLIPNFPYAVERTTAGEGGSYIINTNTNRSSNDNATAYILNSVTYPTGGKTTYEYEINQILTDQQTPAGGVRVKKINHWSSDGQLAETRSYKYGIGECGYGQGISMIPSMFVNESSTWVYYWLNPTIDYLKFRNRALTGTPVNSMFMSELPPATYQEVTEYIGDNTGNNSGKIVYQYSFGNHPIFSAYNAYVDNYYQRPVLLSTTTYKNNSGTYSLVNQTSTQYIDYEAETLNSWVVNRYANIMTNEPGNTPSSVEANFHSFFQGALGSVFQYFPAYLRKGIKVPGFERNIAYTASGESIVTDKTYGYVNNDYLYPKTVTITNSNGATTITHYTYPKDYVVGDNPTNSVAQGIKLLKDRNVLAPVIEEYTEVQPGNVIKSGKFTTFKTDQPLPENIFSLNPIASAGSFSPATITSSSHTKSNSYLLRNTVDLYDSYGNIRQITDKTANITTVILYSYGGKLPIAIIKNTTYANLLAYRTDAGINSFSTGFPTDTEVDNFLSNLRVSLPQALITTFTHDPASGITSQTDENGRPTHYVYDAVGRLQLIKDKDGNVVKTFEYKYKQ
jgi:YD repeat-containing protein